MAEMNWKPLADRIAVEQKAAESETASGLVLPALAQEKQSIGVVVAVGDGAVDDTGQRCPMDVACGDEILYSKYGGTEVEVDGRELLILRESDVLMKRANHD